MSLFKSRPKKRQYVRVTAEIKEEVFRLRADGFDYETIAKFTGISTSSVGIIIRNKKDK